MDPGSLLMLVLLMAIFYFMLVRPQRKRMAEHQALVSSLVPGDEVVTIGGLYGFVNRIEDDEVWLEVSEGVEMRFSKQAISRRIGPAGEAEESESTQDASDAADAPAETTDSEPPSSVS
jgi:preprotein translocase subunit YajC